MLLKNLNNTVTIAGKEYLFNGLSTPNPTIWHWVKERALASGHWRKMPEGATKNRIVLAARKQEGIAV